jgi:site-specific DNA-methyltransferase (adenine-specific)
MYWLLLSRSDRMEKPDAVKLYKGDIRHLDIEKINIVITSPPYNLGIKYEDWDDSMLLKDYLSFTRDWLKKIYDALPNDGRVCVNIPVKITMPHDTSINIPLEAEFINIACDDIGFKYHNTIIWDKGNIVKTCWGSFANASSPFIRDNIECIIVLYKDVWKRLTSGTTTITNGDFTKWTQTLWHFKAEKNRDHPAPFPVELPLRCIKLFSYQEDCVLDPFIGSGTTALACEMANREWIGVDISQNYIDMTRKKVEEYRNILKRRKLFGMDLYE